MGQQHHVVEADERCRDMRLVGEHVETRAGQTARREQVDQRFFVDHAAPRHVHQKTVGPQRLEDITIDELPGVFTT